MEERVAGAVELGLLAAALEAKEAGFSFEGGALGSDGFAH